MGDYAKAEPLYQRALKIEEKVARAGTSRNRNQPQRSGVDYYDMGDYAKAEPLFQRALKIREKALGPEHPATAASLDGLAAGCIARWAITPKRNRSSSAPSKSTRKRLDRSISRPRRPSAVWGGFIMDGRLRQSGTALQRALKIREKSLAQIIRTTAQSLNNLASLYEDWVTTPRPNRSSTRA